MIPASTPAISPAGTVTTPGTYGAHPIPPSEAQAVPAPDVNPHAYDMHRLSSQLGALAGLLGHMDATLDATRPKPDVYQVFQLTSAPHRLDRFDRRFSRLLVGANVAVTLDTGIGNITLNLTAGWNILNYPDGAAISTAATAANVLYLCSDSQHG
ncbi:MAG TPA: hypothetical protein VKQ30_23245 [Ktedonobacterales bacterium]|nr:hypothetical protein [Ktedonobacterales bacterium]